MRSTGLTAHPGVAGSAPSLTHYPPRSEATLREPSARGFLRSLACSMAPWADLTIAAEWVAYRPAGVAGVAGSAPWADMAVDPVAVVSAAS